MTWSISSNFVIDRIYVAICPGYGGHSREEWRRKEWPHWKEFQLQSPCSLVLIGSLKDEEEYGEILPDNKCCGWPIDIAATALREARCVVAADNGLAHMAAALGVKTIALFGATSEVKNRPLGRNVTVLSSNISCRPCQMESRWDNCQDWKCMKEITPEMVLEAMK